MQRRVHIVVYGRVQGVSYRATARKQAAALGLVGWTRNLACGTVELVAEGPSVAVSAFIEWCRQGPRWARVDELKVTEQDPGGEFASFDVRRDG